MHVHCTRGHEKSWMFGNLSFFLGILTPICLAGRESAAMTATIIVGNVAWLVFLLFARHRARRQPPGKIGKLSAREYYYNGLINYLGSALLAGIFVCYFARHR
jgi:hypothetical protein